MNHLSGRYSIAGLGMVVGLPAEELERRRRTLGAEALRDAVPLPLQGLTKRELEAEAVRRAIEDAGLAPHDVDGAVHVHGGPRSGGALGEQMDAYPRMLGLPVNFYYRVGRGGAWGTWGIATAISLLELGVARYVAIAGSCDDWSRSHRPEVRQRGFVGQVQRQRPGGMWGPVYGRTAAVQEHTMFACRHMHEFGTTSRQFGAAAVQIRAWATRNPLARMYGRPATIEDYERSPVLVWPYHLMDMSVSSDGAVAVILTSTERARACASRPVRVLGIGFGDAQGGQWWEGARHYVQLPVAHAKEAAFGQAGLTLEDVDVTQLYDCFTGEVIMQVEDYGWCAKGEGGAYVEAGHIGPGGRTPMNTSGGLLSAYHLADLTGICESVVQLRGQAGDRQVAGAEVSMVTGHGGEVMSPGMCSIHSTMLLGRD